jgi:hypothetical protein
MENRKLKMNDLTPMQVFFVAGQKGEAARAGEPFNQVMLRERPDGTRFVQFYRKMALCAVYELPVADNQLKPCEVKPGSIL